MILKGYSIAKEINNQSKERISKLEGNVKLAIVLIGSNQDSIRYIEHKMKKASEIGATVKLLTYPETVSKEEVIGVIRSLNSDNTISGILVQMPLPKLFVEKYGDNVSRELIDVIDPIKDVDGLTTINIGKYTEGEGLMIPATALGVMRLVKEITEVKGKNMVIINRSLIVGKPLALLAIKEDAVVTVLHSKVEDISKYTKNADIVVAATGKSGIIKADMVKEGSVVIDVGINLNEEGKLVGDVETDLVSEIASVTPVPGGVGPLTIAYLLANLVTAHEQQNART